MIVVICVLMFIFSSCFFPTTSAVTFKTGNKISETDEGTVGYRWYYFDSGCMVQIKPDYINYLPLILDGNESTGINKNFNNGQWGISLSLFFAESIYVKNITVKPTFQNSTSKYDFGIMYKRSYLMLIQSSNKEKTFKINGIIDGVELQILDKNYGSGNESGFICFNDLIIDYTPSPKDTDEQKQIKNEPQIFDIGKKMNSDLNSIRYYPYTSKVIADTDPDLASIVPLIFDGNLSTGINSNKIVNDSRLDFRLHFLYPLYVNNITIKPRFGGGSSNFSLSISLFIGSLKSLEGNSEITYQINGPISGFILRIFQNGTNQFYFNDVIINYTPTPSDFGNCNCNYDNNNFSKIQNQLYFLELNINSITNDISNLQKDIADLKDKINNIKNNNQSSYDNATLQKQIDNLTQEINSIKENLTKINDSIPLAYDDSALKSSMFILESDNIIIKQKIGNLTGKLENLTSELEKIKEQVEEKEGVSQPQEVSDKQESTYVILAIVIIIVLLLVILKLALTVLKREHHHKDERVSDNNKVSETVYEVPHYNEIKSADLSDGEFKELLDKKYQNGDMSKDTYDYIKNILESFGDEQNIKSYKKN